MPMLRLSGRASCPAREAWDYLERFLLEHAVGDDAVLALRPALMSAVLPDLMLVRDCVVTIHPAATGGPAAVMWRLAGDDAAVGFDGTLAIVAGRDESACSVRLSGRYHPPSHIMASVLERSMGRCIAESAGRDLLGRVTQYLAASYRSVQAARVNRRMAQR